MPTQTRGAKRKAGTLGDDLHSLPPNHRDSRPRIEPSRRIQSTRSMNVAPPQSAFLNLPPELRNEIYRMCVVEKKPIKVGARLPRLSQPGVLQISRQVRSETIKIYYQENKFLHIIQWNNCTLYRKWCQTFPHYVKYRHQLRVDHSKNWPNLLEWFRAFYHGECHGMAANSDGSPYLIASLFTLLQRMRDDQLLAWHQIAANLEDIHQGLVAIDPAWA